MMGRMLATAAAVALIGGAAQAASVTVTVNGSSNPYLAGHAPGFGCCGGDSVPGQASVLVPGVLIQGGVITFSGSGGFNYAGGTAQDSLDGDHSGQTLTYAFSMPADNGTGIAGAGNVNVDGLVGVFLSGAEPSGAAPAGIAYAPGGNSGGLADPSYAPGLNQIFWIGDGLTGTGTGSVQQFTVPTGATRLFLGTVDGSGWYNNSGTGTVTVSGLADAVGGVPEPATWAMMILGLGATGLVLRRRSASPAAA